ncbi:hypothetical protein DFA_05467 [Cavenderia fasciculata]|uniref:Uncharacterized protein n=1 Tax=Cavenderia fasciculata TaxID=261658 RepID=F4PLB3_CACFS|nr:uncharacterized protein DFA_05467 [Cavenderia fasciculata]EGG23335.1 hypothetical protein DFA_05467 [Cavenderia fasciculata]|eukprot:XP_004361186.1 hypothetical protein DFA_05467 [Cavenderia fasciculata]
MKSSNIIEINKYLQESWNQSTIDKKKNVLHVEPSTHKANLTSGSTTLMSDLKKSYTTFKQSSPLSVDKKDKDTPAWA